MESTNQTVGNIFASIYAITHYVCVTPAGIRTEHTSQVCNILIRSPYSEIAGLCDQCLSLRKRKGVHDLYGLLVVQ